MNPSTRTLGKRVIWFAAIFNAVIFAVCVFCGIKKIEITFSPTAFLAANTTLASVVTGGIATKNFRSYRANNYNQDKNYNQSRGGEF
jgi:F0F1-type ATP synthase membrane subunit a